MAFQTGTASSFINLLDALRLFATANGWTQNQWTAVGADQWLSLQKGSIYANFLAEADNSDLLIVGALGYNGASAWDAQPSTNPYKKALSSTFYGSIAWPVAYWFFNHTAPDSIEVVIRYQPTRHQWVMFGTITKYGTWLGGEYYGASKDTLATDHTRPAFVNQFGTGNSNSRTPVLFHSQGGGSSSDVRGITSIHAEIDSNVWQADGTFGAIICSDRHIFPLVNRSLSAFNGLATLQPIELYALRPDAHWSPLGRVEHVRYANVLNHNAGDIIDIGGQKWMVFPWLEKGGATDNTPTVLHAGMAIKYDGP